MKQKFTVTAALPYANGPIHLGHIAGVYLPADIFVRFLRMNGDDVLFVCGSDEHGAAITLRAKKEGVSPKDIVDRYHQLIGDAFTQFGIEFDVYHPCKKYYESEKIILHANQECRLYLDQ